MQRALALPLLCFVLTASPEIYARCRKCFQLLGLCLGPSFSCTGCMTRNVTLNSACLTCTWVYCSTPCSCSLSHSEGCTCCTFPTGFCVSQLLTLSFTASPRNLATCIGGSCSSCPNCTGFLLLQRSNWMWDMQLIGLYVCGVLQTRPEAARPGT